MAPAAMVRPARLRLYALAALAIAGLLAQGAQSTVQVVAILWAIGLAVVVAVGAVCEGTPLVPTRYAWFFRSRWRRPLAYLFAPGWPAGVAFALLLTLVTAAAWVASNESVAALIGLAYVPAAVAGTLLLPVAVGRTLLPRARPFLVLLLTTLCSWGLTILAPIALYLESEALWPIGCALLALCPSAFAQARLRKLGDFDLYPTTQIPVFADAIFGLVVGAAVVVSVGLAVREWRVIRRLFAPAP